VANKTKRYDLKAADRRRSMLIQVGLTAVVIVFAVGMLLLILKPWAPKAKKPVVPGPPAGTVQAITAAAPEKLVKDAAGKPKVVLSMFEDFLCPHCGTFEKGFGSTVKQLIDSGTVQADYYMVALSGLDVAGAQFYSSRAGSAAYCVAEFDASPTKEAFQRFHSTLYANQPEETSSTFPTDDDLVARAHEAGVEGTQVSDCIRGGKYLDMVRGLVRTTGLTHTPTIKINGQEIDTTTLASPQDLINKVNEASAAAPAPPAPTPAAP
jgi:protein-disulfide isomerase